jgi:phosphatidylserine/phosphatidylglycerophosphate/cardiolipin synthase-like enzyme
LPRYTENNRITPILDGIPTFSEMVAVMHTITDSSHYLRLAGWWLNDDFALIPGDSTSTFAQLSQTMATAGAQVRALLWDQWGTQNNAEVDHINALPRGNGRAILDNETPNFGSHHQKIMIVNGSGGAVAFCGGVDLNPDRLDDGHHCARSPFHDAHAKVEGPAVGDLNTTFVQRWNAHPSHPPVLSTAAPPFATNPGSQYVQLTRTFAPRFGYPFAPAGDLGTLNAMRRAIQRAQRFIYFEDQYATPYPGSYPYVASQDTVGILTDLLAALARPSFEYLIILLPNHTDQPQNRYRRHKFIHPLRDAFPDKVHVFYLSRTCPARGPATGSTTAAADLNLLGPAATPAAASQSSSGPSHPNEIYVHAKTWIVDDVYVKIGSCNCNRRGFTHDTEVDFHIVDGALQSGARSFARNYRMVLWGEHLNMSGAARRALLEDPAFALQFWLHPPTGAKISPYDETAELGSGNLDSIWNTFVDPDGR